MKLKQKLAKEFCKNAEGAEEYRLMRVAYLAGFEKAIEVSIRFLNNYADDMFEHYDQGYISSTECAYAKNNMRRAAERFKKFGDTEV